MTVKPCALRRKRQGPPARLSGHRNKAARWLPLELSGWVTVRVLVRTWTNEYASSANCSVHEYLFVVGTALLLVRHSVTFFPSTVTSRRST